MFERDYESCLMNEDSRYEEYKKKIGIKYGKSGKGISAMKIALKYQSNDEKPPQSIKNLIDRIFKLKEKLN